ncbi:MAG TPA: hypothetical protein VH253_10455 [Phycisphaerae bacterium]|nr:hypothetical protein [Phycisphaerae bacterium]
MGGRGWALALAVGGMGLLMGARGAWADGALENPPGVYFGMGNPNTHYTVVDDGGIELGLKAFLAFGPDVIVPAGNIYTVPAGAQTSGPDAGDALWDVAFSVDLTGTALNLSNVNVDLAVEDLTTGIHAPVIPIGAIPDNSFYPSGSNMSNAQGEQNAENPSFLPGFDLNAPDQYLITLFVTNEAGNTVLASDTIQVNVAPAPAPLPAAAGPMGVVLGAVAGMGWVRRRRGGVAVGV